MANIEIHVDIIEVSGRRALAFTDQKGNDATNVIGTASDTFQWFTDTGTLDIKFDRDRHPFHHKPKPVPRQQPGEINQVTKPASRSYKYTAKVTDDEGPVSQDPRVIIDPGPKPPGGNRHHGWKRAAGIGVGLLLLAVVVVVTVVSNAEPEE